MNSKQTRTLRSVFAKPARANVDWADIESLLVAVGCEAVEGAGSRVRFVFGDHIESFHRPHPEKEAKRYQMRQAKDFLTKIGVTP